MPGVGIVIVLIVTVSMTAVFGPRAPMPAVGGSGL
jgi:hypothetical protein